MLSCCYNRNDLLIEGRWCTRIVFRMNFGTYPIGWHIEGDLLAVSTDSTVYIIIVRICMHITCEPLRKKSYLYVRM